MAVFPLCIAYACAKKRARPLGPTPWLLVWPYNHLELSYITAVNVITI
jgi:hypothetical protein